MGRRWSGWPTIALKTHMKDYVGQDPDSLIFTGAKGTHLRASTFGPAVKCGETVAALGLPNVHFHDLRHTGNNLAASAGASTRELMHRMGHSTVRAALVYQHATSERDREIARSMDRRIARKAGQAADREGGQEWPGHQV